MTKEMLFLGLIGLTTSSYAYSGGVDGGGGKSVVCRDNQGKIISAEVLDLYEGRVQYGLTPAIRNSPIEDQIEEVVDRLSIGRGANFKETVMNTTNFVNATKVILPDGTGLIPVDDSHHVVAPKSCQVEQLANFTNQKQVLINGEIWNALNSTNKAALIVHEALYKVFRMYGAKNSIRARKSVAIGFAGGSSSMLWDGVPSRYYQCHTVPNSEGSPLPGSQFRAYNDQNGGLIFQFDYLDGQLMLTKSTMYIDKIPVDQMAEIADAIYWLNLNSSFDMFLGVALSFKRVVENGELKMVMKIGIGNMPMVPTAEFKCSL